MRKFYKLEEFRAFYSLHSMQVSQLHLELLPDKVVIKKKKKNTSKTSNWDIHGMHVQCPQPHLGWEHASAPQTLSINPFPSMDSVQVLTVSSRVQRQHWILGFCYTMVSTQRSTNTGDRDILERRIQARHSSRLGNRNPYLYNTLWLSKKPKVTRVALFVSSILKYMLKLCRWKRGRDCKQE